MTPEQNALFVEISRMGIACGLTHPFEWFDNYNRSSSPQKKNSTLAWECYRAFYDGIDEYHENLTLEGLKEEMEHFFAERNHRFNQTVSS
jgi:hypothetical protein